MRISDWSSDVCSSDLIGLHALFDPRPGTPHSENSPSENSPSENSLPPRLAALAGALDAHLADIHEAPAPHRLRSLAASIALLRSEVRRVGQECVNTCRSRWSPSHSQKKKNIKH